MAIITRGYPPCFAAPPGGAAGPRLRPGLGPGCSGCAAAAAHPAAAARGLGRVAGQQHQQQGQNGGGGGGGAEGEVPGLAENDRYAGGSCETCDVTSRWRIDGSTCLDVNRAGNHMVFRKPELWKSFLHLRKSTNSWGNSMKQL